MIIGKWNGFVLLVYSGSWKYPFLDQGLLFGFHPPPRNFQFSFILFLYKIWPLRPPPLAIFSDHPWLVSFAARRDVLRDDPINDCEGHLTWVWLLDIFWTRYRLLFAVVNVTKLSVDWLLTGTLMYFFFFISFHYFFVLCVCANGNRVPFFILCNFTASFFPLGLATWLN